LQVHLTIIATPDPITATGTLAVNPDLSITSISATTGTFTNINLTNYNGVVKSVGATSAPNYSLVVASGANTGKVKQLVAGTNITLTETDTDHVSIAAVGGGGGVTSVSAANSTIIATPDPITATGTLAVNPDLSITSISATTGTFTNINLTNYDGVVKSVGATSAPNYSLVVASGANTGKVKQLVAGTNITLTETDTDHVSIAAAGLVVKSFSASKTTTKTLGPGDLSGGFYTYNVVFDAIDYNIGSFVVSGGNVFVNPPTTGIYIVTIDMSTLFASGYMRMYLAGAGPLNHYIPVFPSGSLASCSATATAVLELTNGSPINLVIQSEVSGGQIFYADLKIEYLHA
jgi:hypothetical protein